MAGAGLLLINGHSEELAKENKNDTLLEKVTMLRENEQRQFDKACARLKRPYGKSEESKKGGKKDDEDKDGKGKPDEKVGRPKDEKEREKGKEGEAQVCFCPAVAGFPETLF